MPLVFLKTLGLTDNEANLYELLLKLGEVPANQIIKESKLKRATAYKVLYALEEKKLVSKRDVGKIIHFRPEPPIELLNLAEDQYKSLERARNDLRAVLPELNSSYILSVQKPVVSIFEGRDGLKKIYEDLLRENKEVLSVLQAAEIDPEMYQWLTKDFVRRRVRAKIFAKVIVASSRQSLEYVRKSKKEYRESIAVPKEMFPFQHEVMVYGDKIAFVDYRKGSPLIGLLINHPLMAQTMRAWFYLSWKGAETFLKSK